MVQVWRLELPEAEFERRRRATNHEWPLLNCTLDGVTRDDLMGDIKVTILQWLYVDDDKLAFCATSFVAQALTQGIQVKVAGDAINLL